MKYIVCTIVVLSRASSVDVYFAVPDTTDSANKLLLLCLFAFGVNNPSEIMSVKHVVAGLERPAEHC